MRLGRVFVSSVFGGMSELRQRAADAARLLGLEAVLTEGHVAQPGTVRDALAREIALADLYVGLFDRRRGTVPDAGTVDSRAITEEELRLAREHGLRCLVFLSRDGAAAREPGLAEFLEREVSAYATGVWARPYGSPASLLQEIAAALSALRPWVVLALGSGATGGSARLFLGGLQPAWAGPAVLGPVAVDLGLGAGSRGVFDAFRRGPASRNRLREEDLRAAGGDLAARALPGPLGEALADVLDLAGGRLVTLEVRTGDDVLLVFPWELLSLPGHPLPVRTGALEVVRRLVLPGDPDDPAGDPAPSVPPDRLAILGFTAAPPEDQVPGALPGAGGLAGDSDLFWEREQERLLAALDGLLREGRGRLILPDTGDREELRAQLQRSERPHVVHIACHGGTVPGPGGAPEPALFLEDAEGRRAPLTGPELLSWVRASGGAPELLVLAACSTAGAAAGSSPEPGLRAAVAEAAVGRAAGLAEALVRGGLPRVLGMQSTVSDGGATAFAFGLYAALGRGTDLPAALRAGRVELAVHGGPHEWAIPTLTLRGDAGPLAAPEGSAPREKTPFEVAAEVFRIAGVSYLDRGYVGRREAERRLRRAFERGERVLVLHGLGGIGKSTLAARFLARRREEGARVLVLYAGRALPPAAFLDEVAAQVGVARPAGLAPEEAEARFRAALGEALRAVDPTLLYLDNFEDNQDAEGRLLHEELGIALLDLARLAVALPPSPIEPCNLDLGELSPSGCRKLRLLDPDGLGQLEESAWQQVLLHLGGHPKALELLGGYLRGRLDRARSLVRQLDEAIRVIDGKLSAKDQERGRSLLVDTVLESVPEARRAAFDRLCLLELPLQSEELESLLAAEGLPDATGDIAWFRDHGLLARAVGPSALGGGDLVHRLLASRREGALAEQEGEDAARGWHLRVAEHLVERPGPLSDFGAAARHRDAAGDRAGALALYNLWALAMREGHAYAACVQIAHEGLLAFATGESEAERIEAAKLWTNIHDGLEPLGKIAEADETLADALQVLEGLTSPEAGFFYSSLLLRRGRRLASSAQVAEAEDNLAKSLAGFTQGGHTLDRTTVLGEIARLRARTGDVSGALKLFEELIAIFEQHGDVRERAVTLGDIARLLAQAGDVVGAIKLLSERLAIFRELGDVEGIAATQFDLAQCHLQESRPEAALSQFAEAWEMVNRIGRMDAVASVGSLYGGLLLATDREQARPVPRRSRDAYQLLGRTAEASEIDGWLREKE